MTDNALNDLNIFTPFSDRLLGHTGERTLQVDLLIEKNSGASRDWVTVFLQ